MNLAAAKWRVRTTTPAVRPLAGARRRVTGRGFTLIEMIVTTVLTAVLLAVLLTVTTGISRDRKRLAAATEGGRPAAGSSSSASDAMLGLLRQDLTNARTLDLSPDGQAVVLVGHGGLSRASMTPSGRLTRVTYRVRAGRGAGGPGGGGGPSCLVREQQYLDDPARPEPWAEVVAIGVRRFAVAPASPGGQAADAPDQDAPPDEEPSDDAAGEEERADDEEKPGRRAVPVPASVRVRVEFDGGAIDELLRVR